MTTSSVPGHAVVVSDERVLRAAVAAYLGRYRAESRVHTGSDLKVFLTWCVGQDVDPLELGRVEIVCHPSPLDRCRDIRSRDELRPAASAQVTYTPPTRR